MLTGQRPVVDSISVGDLICWNNSEWVEISRTTVAGGAAEGLLEKRVRKGGCSRASERPRPRQTTSRPLAVQGDPWRGRTSMMHH